MTQGRDLLLGNGNSSADRTLLTLGQALFGAGCCLAGNGYFLMTQGRDLLLGNGDSSADRTLLTLGQALLSTGCCLAGNSLNVMVQCWLFVTSTGFATDFAGVGGVALFGTGRRGYNFLFSMALCPNRIVSIAVLTDLTGISGIAIFGTGRRSYNCLVGVIQFLYYFGVAVVTIFTFTGNGLFTLRGAGSFLGYLLLIVVLQRVHGFGIGITAVCAGVGLDPILSAGRRSSYNALIVMAQFFNLSLFNTNITTDGTHLAVSQTRFCTGRFLTFNNFVLMFTHLLAAVITIMIMILIRADSQSVPDLSLDVLMACLIRVQLLTLSTKYRHHFHDVQHLVFQLDGNIRRGNIDGVAGDHTVTQTIQPRGIHNIVHVLSQINLCITQVDHNIFHCVVHTDNNHQRVFVDLVDLIDHLRQIIRVGNGAVCVCFDCGGQPVMQIIDILIPVRNTCFRNIAPDFRQRIVNIDNILFANIRCPVIFGDIFCPNLIERIVKHRIAVEADSDQVGLLDIRLIACQQFIQVFDLHAGLCQVLDLLLSQAQFFCQLIHIALGNSGAITQSNVVRLVISFINTMDSIQICRVQICLQIRDDRVELSRGHIIRNCHDLLNHFRQRVQRALDFLGRSHAFGYHFLNCHEQVLHRIQQFLYQFPGCFTVFTNKADHIRHDITDYHIDIPCILVQIFNQIHQVVVDILCVVHEQREGRCHELVIIRDQSQQLLVQHDQQVCGNPLAVLICLVLSRVNHSHQGFTGLGQQVRVVFSRNLGNDPADLIKQSIIQIRQVALRAADQFIIVLCGIDRISFKFLVQIQQVSLCCLNGSLNLRDFLALGNLLVDLIALVRNQLTQSIEDIVDLTRGQSGLCHQHVDSVLTVTVQDLQGIRGSLGQILTDRRAQVGMALVRDLTDLLHQRGISALDALNGIDNIGVDFIRDRLDQLVEAGGRFHRVTDVGVHHEAGLLCQLLQLGDVIIQLGLQTQQGIPRAVLGCQSVIFQQCLESVQGLGSRVEFCQQGCLHAGQFCLYLKVGDFLLRGGHSADRNIDIANSLIHVAHGVSHLVSLGITHIHIAVGIQHIVGDQQDVELILHSQVFPGKDDLIYVLCHLDQLLVGQFLTGQESGQNRGHSLDDLALLLICQITGCFQFISQRYDNIQFLGNNGTRAGAGTAADDIAHANIFQSLGNFLDNDDLVFSGDSLVCQQRGGDIAGNLGDHFISDLRDFFGIANSFHDLIKQVDHNRIGNQLFTLFILNGQLTVQLDNRFHLRIAFLHGIIGSQLIEDSLHDVQLLFHSQLTGAGGRSAGRAGGCNLSYSQEVRPDITDQFTDFLIIKDTVLNSCVDFHNQSEFPGVGNLLDLGQFQNGLQEIQIALIASQIAGRLQDLIEIANDLNLLISIQTAIGQQSFVDKLRCCDLINLTCQHLAVDIHNDSQSLLVSNILIAGQVREELPSHSNLGVGAQGLVALQNIDDFLQQVHLFLGVHAVILCQEVVEHLQISRQILFSFFLRGLVESSLHGSAQVVVALGCGVTTQTIADNSASHQAQPTACSGFLCGCIAQCIGQCQQGANVIHGACNFSVLGILLCNVTTLDILLCCYDFKSRIAPLGGIFCVIGCIEIQNTQELLESHVTQFQDRIQGSGSVSACQNGCLFKGQVHSTRQSQSLILRC